MSAKWLRVGHRLTWILFLVVVIAVLIADILDAPNLRVFYAASLVVALVSFVLGVARIVVAVVQRRRTRAARIREAWRQPVPAVPKLPPCDVCGFSVWPPGGMHAARSIHMRAHERAGIYTPPQSP